MNAEHITLEQQKRLVEESRDLYEKLWPVPAEQARSRGLGACLFHATALQAVLWVRHRVKAQMQAGSVQWPFARPEDDDGASPTHFSYQWNGLGDPDTALAVLSDAMPEMHVWLVVIPGGGEATLIDPTVGTWPDRARRAGFEWRTPEPPKWLWHRPTELAELARRDFALGVRYEAAEDACKVAWSMARRSLMPDIVRWIESLRQRKEEERP